MLGLAKLNMVASQVLVVGSTYPHYKVGIALCLFLLVRSQPVLIMLFVCPRHVGLMVLLGCPNTLSLFNLFVRYYPVCLVSLNDQGKDKGTIIVTAQLNLIISWSLT